MDVEAKVKEIIIDKLGVEDSQITPEASFTNDLGADSLDIVELVMGFESEFDISIPDERLSTVEAKHLLMQAGTKGDKIKLKCDAAAATLILQRYLDNLEVRDR